MKAPTLALAALCLAIPAVPPPDSIGAGEEQVIPWKGSLAVINLPTDNPLQALTKLKHMGGNTFRRIRDDDTLAEEITFEIGPDGDVLRMKQHSNYSDRIR